MKIRGIAHRGFPTKYPENTLSSFQAALDLSFTHMETDVQLSKDGVPVIMHDTSVNRMTNGKGQVKDFTLEELKKLRVGESETIPTLEEGLRLAKGRITVVLELKQHGHLYPGLEQKTIELIRKLDMVDQLIVSSFDHYALARMRSLDKDIRLSFIMSGASPALFPYMKEIGADHVSIALPYLTPECAEDHVNNGVQLIVRPIDTEEAMRKMLDYPSVLPSTNTAGPWKQFYEAHISGR